MNWLDILLIVIYILLFVIGIITIVVAIIKKDDYFSEATVIAIGYWIVYLIFGWLLFLPFIVLDRGSGSTIGVITSVDKNFFGTTAIYIKTSETTQEKYCIEDEKVVEKAKELIGKNVKAEYGTRVGLYSTGRCSSAPIEKIELLEIND